MDFKSLIRRFGTSRYRFTSYYGAMNELVVYSHISSEILLQLVFVGQAKLLLERISSRYSIMSLLSSTYIELLKFFLTFMTQWLRERASEFSATALYQHKALLKVKQLNRYNEISQLKLVHFKLWQLSINFNCIFGWSLGAIIVRNSMEIAYGAYWLFMYTFREAHYLVILRKWADSSLHWSQLTASLIRKK